MAKTTKTKEEEVKPAEQPAEDTTESGDSVSVQYVNPQSGLSVRAYSLATHGKDFKKLAKDFAEKRAGVIV